jgi:hypothetical protein
MQRIVGFLAQEARGISVLQEALKFSDRFL